MHIKKRKVIREARQCLGKFQRVSENIIALEGRAKNCINIRQNKMVAVWEGEPYRWDTMEFARARQVELEVLRLRRIERSTVPFVRRIRAGVNPLSFWGVHSVLIACQD
jgi:hypothetical protein